MFLARIDGTITSTIKHPTLVDARLLIAQRLESNGEGVGEPMVVIDPIGAKHGATVLVSSDGDIVRQMRGNNVPGRMVVVGIVDHVNVEVRP